MSEKCPTCGSPVKVFGKTTMHYKPIRPTITKEEVEEIVEQVFVNYHFPLYGGKFPADKATSYEHSLMRQIKTSSAMISQALTTNLKEKGL